MANRIILIEDNIDHRVMTTRILKSSDEEHSVECSANAEEGLRRLMQERFDVVLCDYRLPGITALDVLRTLRGQGNDIPFIVVTSAGDEKTAVTLMKEGASDYVVKDSTYAETLPLVIERSLERYSVTKEKKCLEERVHQQKVFLEQIIRSLRYPFYVINKDFQIVLTNRAQAGPDSKICYASIHGRDRPCSEHYPCMMEEVIKTGKPVYYEYQREGNGSADNPSFMEVYADPIINPDGSIDQIIEYFIDSTQRKKTEQALREAYQKVQETQEELIQSGKMAAMGQLAAGISHELNQPLTGIKGFSQAILMDISQDNPIYSDLKRIVEQVDRMSQIIQNIRFFARKSAFKKQEISVRLPIDDSLMLLQEQLRVHNIAVQVSIPPDLPCIYADANQLQQVFLNLLTNARDAIDSGQRPEGGMISVDVEMENSRQNVAVAIHDNGCGIPQNVIEHIFNPFFTTKSPDKGIGLGLAIVYRIIKNHQGNIYVESTPGEGTTFRIVLPVHHTADEADGGPRTEDVPSIAK